MTAEELAVARAEVTRLRAEAAAAEQFLGQLLPKLAGMRHRGCRDEAVDIVLDTLAGIRGGAS